MSKSINGFRWACGTMDVDESKMHLFASHEPTKTFNEFPQASGTANGVCCSKCASVYQMQMLHSTAAPHEQMMNACSSEHHCICICMLRGNEQTKKGGGPFEPPSSLHFPLRGQCQSLPCIHHPLWVEWTPHIHSCSSCVPGPACEWSWMPKHALAGRHLHQ